MSKIICKSCKHELKQVPVGNGWAHTEKAHWTGRGHKAKPTMSAAPDFKDLLAMAGSQTPWSVHRG